MSDMTIEKLMRKIKSYNPDAAETVRKAYEFAKNLHEGQYRQSGEPYIIHPLNVTYILAELHADCDTLCAGMLHDTLEDTETTKEEITEIFNETVANLVDGVTKLAKMNFSSKEEQRLANTRKIITGITEDVRIIIIKLADRLHNMRTLQYKNIYKQKENSIETLDIFVPLAYYIGQYRIKSELEDLSLRYLNPDLYRQISEEKNIIELSSEECLKEMVYKINNLLTDRDIPHEIKVRTKNIYGIYKKKMEGSKITDIHDLLALKIMVDEIDSCYTTLGIIHKEYKPVPKRMKDYIWSPKTNMYRSLHTTVFGPDEKIVQTQIRTFDMDKVASFGLTALWHIKKGEARYAMQEHLKSKCQFFDSLKEIDSTFEDDSEFVRQVKEELFAANVYPYTPTGDVIELPKGATIIDYAYKYNPTIANQMIEATVNDEIVPLNYVIQNQDRIKLKVDELSIGPNPIWIDLAKTAYAKRKILEHSKQI